PGYIIKDSSTKDIYVAFIDSFLEKHDEQNDLLKILNLELEAELIKKVGDKLKNNKSAMSRVLGISRVTLQKKCHRPASSDCSIVYLKPYKLYKQCDHLSF
ncbi:unnamed protein product, partial [marine sediment metagenome]